MNIAVAQIRPESGNIAANILKHQKCVEVATLGNCDALFFPELSLTGYEPTLATDLAFDSNDDRLRIFQDISSCHNMTIAVGVPMRVANGIHISMLLFRPHKPRLIYAKQQLHDDELPFFVPGSGQLILDLEEVKIAPAICYESLQPAHAETAKKAGADLYVASVAKPQRAIDKAYKHYPLIAQKHQMPVLMANATGFCDNFISAGQSAVWNKEGRLLANLDANCEGIIVFDTDKEQARVTPW